MGSLRKMAFASAAAAAVTMMAALSATPAYAQRAQEQPQPVEVQPADSQNIRVPMRDARGMSEEVVRAGAAMRSKDGQAIAFFSNDETAFQSLRNAARQAIANGIPLKIVVIADPLQEKNVNGYHIAGSSRVMFFADGARTATLDNASGDISAAVSQELQRGYEQVVKPRRARAILDKTGPSASQ